MKKTLLAGFIALTLSAISNSASAISIDNIELRHPSTTDTWAMSGVFDSDNLGTTGGGEFFAAPWINTSVAFFDVGSGANTWAGTSDQGSYSYNFTLTGNQLAFGISVDWSVSADIPMLAIFDCGAGNPGDTCSGSAVPMQNGPFVGQPFYFDGTVSAVPVPAAVWLFGSGLIGLIGFAQRKNNT